MTRAKAKRRPRARTVRIPAARAAAEPVSLVERLHRLRRAEEWRRKGEQVRRAAREN